MPKKEEKPDLGKLLEEDTLEELKKSAPEKEGKEELKKAIARIKTGPSPEEAPEEEEPAPKAEETAEKKAESSILSKMFGRGKAEEEPSRPKFMKEAMEKKGEKEKLPTPEELEAEWKEKIKEAKRKEEAILPGKPQGRREESLESAFERLKEKPAEAPKAAPKEGARLARIGGVVKGEVPEIRERELAGIKIPFIYRLFPIGQLPPLNLLSKIYLRSRADSLDVALDTTRIPLYPAEFTAFATAFGFMMSLVVFLLVALLTGFDFVLAILAMVVSLFGISLFVLMIPSSRLKSSTRDINKHLPFALRHMSALLSAGISIFDAMISVARADYGALSYELDEVVWDVKSGESLSDALEISSTQRVKSKSYNRMVVHIRRALQMGGNISEIISQIADDLTFEMRMKISDFVEKLNAFAIVYLIGGIVGPVVIAIFSVIQSIPVFGGGGDAGMTPAFLMLVIFPLMMILIVYMVKVMEPKV